MAKHKVYVSDFFPYIKAKLTYSNRYGEKEKELWMVYCQTTEQAWFIVEFVGVDGWQKSGKVNLDEAIKLYNEI